MAGKMFRMCAVSAAVMGLVVLSPLDAQAAVTYNARALTGDVAPDMEAGVTFDSFLAPVLNAAGHTAFEAFLTGTSEDFTNSRSIWSEGSGSLHLTVRFGDTAPGTEPGVVYSSGFDTVVVFSAPVLNAAGQVAFSSFLSGPGVDSTNDRGIWLEQAGSLGLVVREGAAAPGTEPGVVYRNLDIPRLNDAGITAFTSSLTGPGVDSTNSSGIWSGALGSLSLVARTGAAAPDTGAGVVYSTFFDRPLINAAGQITFGGLLTGPGVDVTNDSGIWSGSPDGPSLVAREGGAAPDTESGVVYGNLGISAFNGAGQTAFLASLTGLGVVTSNDRGIWSEGSGSLKLVAREGDAAPNTGEGVVYNGFNSPVLINAAGQTAFSGSMTGLGVDNTNNGGIWSGGDGSLKLIAREGSHAPGTAIGVAFRDLSIRIFPVLNGVGQIAFRSFLTGSGVDSSNNLGLWATDPNGVLSLIARTGDLFDVNDDPLIEDLRLITSLSLATQFASSGGEDGRATSFNDAGQLAYLLRFSDGSQGIFVATIPEPGTLGLLGVGVGMILRRRG